MNTVLLTDTFEIITCGGCGCTFALPESLIKQLRETHKAFYCPNGCNRYYPSKNEKEKLQETIQQKENQISRLENEIRIQKEYKEEYRNSLIATKGHNTRLKRRIGNGVCPCCNRHFSNVENHIKKEHPDFGSN